MVSKKKVDFNKVDYYIPQLIEPMLDELRNKVLLKDSDYVFVVDGSEGSGKSVLAQQLAKKLDPSFNIDDIVFNAKDFMNKIKSSDKGKCILFDEVFASANSRSAMSSTNKALIGLATEMRQKNLFVILVLPSFFDLDKYFAIWRCKSLFHVFRNKKGERGNYKLYLNQQKKYLYLMGKKFYEYHKSKSFGNLIFRFSNTYTIDEDLYREKKRKSFEENSFNLDKMISKEGIKLKELQKKIYGLHKKFKIKVKDLAEHFEVTRESINQWSKKEIELNEVDLKKAETLKFGRLRA